MTDVKICGLKTRETVEACVSAGASHIGFNFYTPSPRSVSSVEAGQLRTFVPDTVIATALAVDPDDDLITAIMTDMKPDLLQVHGSETVARIQDIKARFKVPVMKVFRVADNADIQLARDYDGIADRILFDAKAPANQKSALPGGNGAVFDWSLLKDWSGTTDWMLAGGLNPGNVVEAIRQTGAPGVDTASGVEDSPGVKSPEKIREFVRAAKSA